MLIKLPSNNIEDNMPGSEYPELNNECCTIEGCSIECVASKATGDSDFAYANDCVNGGRDGCSIPNYMWPLSGYTATRQYDKPKTFPSFSSSPISEDDMMTEEISPANMFIN